MGMRSTRPPTKISLCRRLTLQYWSGGLSWMRLYYLGALLIT